MKKSLKLFIILFVSGLILSMVYINFIFFKKNQPEQNDNFHVSKNIKNNYNDNIVAIDGNTSNFTINRKNSNLTKLHYNTSLLKLANLQEGDLRGFKILENKFPEGNLFVSWLNPDQNLILVNHSKWRYPWAVYDINGNLILSAPSGVKIGDRNYRVIDWIWKDNQHLVSIMCHFVYPYPDKDYQEVDDVKMFVFKCTTESSNSFILNEINLPKVPYDHLIRIEGVTREGYLVLSDVESTTSSRTGDKFSLPDNNYAEDEKFLGVFDIEFSK